MALLRAGWVRSAKRRCVGGASRRLSGRPIQPLAPRRTGAAKHIGARAAGGECRAKRARAHRRVMRSIGPLSALKVQVSPRVASSAIAVSSAPYWSSSRMKLVGKACARGERPGVAARRSGAACGGGRAGVVGAGEARLGGRRRRALLGDAATLLADGVRVGVPRRATVVAGEPTRASRDVAGAAGGLSARGGVARRLGLRSVDSVVATTAEAVGAPSPPPTPTGSLGGIGSPLRALATSCAPRGFFEAMAPMRRGGSSIAVGLDPSAAPRPRLAPRSSVGLRVRNAKACMPRVRGK